MSLCTEGKEQALADVTKLLGILNTGLDGRDWLLGEVCTTRLDYAPADMRLSSSASCMVEHYLRPCRCRNLHMWAKACRVRTCSRC